MTRGATLRGVTDLHELDDRQLMGLPEQLAERLPADVYAGQGDLFVAEPDVLTTVIEDPAQPFPRRYVAGRLLALRGDPRIRTTDPVLVPVRGGMATVGLPIDQVERVVREWAPFGVRRDWIEKECPEHQVEMGSLMVMRYPVTNQEYRQFLADTGSTELPTSWQFGNYPPERANEPVWTVTAEAADRYAAWLSERTSRPFRLPTEAEWEWIAAGGERREYPWGARFDPDAANTVERGPLTATPVGCYPNGRSRHGVDDLAGNVEEWVADSYRPYPGGRIVGDDLRQLDSAYRICRGGSFTRFGDLARCSRRHGRYARDIYAVGFRLVSDAFGQERAEHAD